MGTLIYGSSIYMILSNAFKARYKLAWHNKVSIQFVTAFRNAMLNQGILWCAPWRLNWKQNQVEVNQNLKPKPLIKFNPLNRLLFKVKFAASFFTKQNSLICFEFQNWSLNSLKRSPVTSRKVKGSLCLIFLYVLVAFIGTQNNSNKRIVILWHL